MSWAGSGGASRSLQAPGDGEEVRVALVQRGLLLGPEGERRGQGGLGIVVDGLELEVARHRRRYAETFWHSTARTPTVDE